MKKFFLILLGAVLIAAAAFAQVAPDTLWTRTYGGSNYDCGLSARQTTDGGFVIAGTVDSDYGWDYGDVWLIKTNANGDTVWTQTYGGNGTDQGRCVQQTNDGGYIIVGSTYSYGAGGRDVYLVKTNANGDTAWTRTFGGSSDDTGVSVQQTSDGGYIIVGYTWSYGAGDWDVYLIKTDANGNESWHRTFGGSRLDTGSSVLQTTDGGYIIAGTTISLTPFGGSDVYLIKTDANGNQLWYRIFGVEGFDNGASVQQTTDGGYIIAGETHGLAVGTMDAWLIKTDANGSQSWNRTFGVGDADEARSVQQTADGGYILAGHTGIYGSASSYDFYIVKTDVSGIEEWHKVLGGSNGDYARSVQQTSDGGYIIAGETYSYGAGGSDVWLIRLERDSLPPAQTIEVTYPNGGEAWQVGSAPTITWAHTGGFDNFCIQLSRNGGSNWETLVMALCRNAVSWSWNAGVTPPASNHCLIKVIGHYGSNNIHDISDSVFSIITGGGHALEVTYPNGGESWQVGSVPTITWAHTGGFDSFDIQLTRNNGSNWETLDSGLLGHAVDWTWNAGVTPPPSNHCRVRIVGHFGGSHTHDISNGLFSITIDSVFVPDEFTHGLWHFNEARGTYTAHDASGRGYNMDLQDGAEFTSAGLYGGCADMSDSDAKINSNHLIGNGWEELTIDAHIKPYSLNPNESPIVERYRFYASNPAYYLTIMPGGQLYAGVYQANGANTSLTTTPIITTMNIWYYVQMTWRSGGELKIFVNGAPAGAVNAGVGVIRNSTHPLTIGWFHDTGYGDFYFDGLIDEVRISNIDRSGAQPPPPPPIWTEDFEDGNFTQNPAWTHRQGEAEVITFGGDYCLDLHATPNGPSGLIEVPIPAVDAFTLEFDVYKRPGYTGRQNNVWISVSEGSWAANTGFQFYENDCDNIRTVWNFTQQNQVGIASFDERWQHIVMTREASGAWTIIWDEGGPNHTTITGQDEYGRLDNPHLWLKCDGFYAGVRGAYFDDFALFSAEPPPPPPSSWRDDFEDGNAEGWTVIEGEWRVISPGARGSQYCYGTGSLIAAAYPREFSAGFFELEVDFWIDNESIGNFGVEFNRRCANNYYMLDLADPDSDDPHARIYRYLNGVETIIAQTPNIIQVPGWHHLKLVRNPENNILVFLDNYPSPYMSVNDGELTVDSEVRFRFYAGGKIDNVDLRTSRSPISIILTPFNPPIVIPSGGEAFAYNIAIANNSGSPEHLDAWVNIEVPGGFQFTILGPFRNIPMPPGRLIERDRTVFVPGRAPAGEYICMGMIGDYPWNIIDSDAFPFVKEGGSAVWLSSDGWYCGGEPFPGEVISPETVMPGETALTGACPNPFNPSTVISFELRDAGLVKLAVYDIKGREVSRLADGFYPAGTHQAVWDASAVASGVYFARLEAGDLVQTRKMLLIK